MQCILVDVAKNAAHVEITQRKFNMMVTNVVVPTLQYTTLPYPLS